MSALERGRRELSEVRIDAGTRWPKRQPGAVVGGATREKETGRTVRSGRRRGEGPRRRLCGKPEADGGPRSPAVRLSEAQVPRHTCRRWGDRPRSTRERGRTCVRWDSPHGCGGAGAVVAAGVRN